MGGGTRYRTITRPGHPLAGKRGGVREHRVVLYEKVGPGPQQCHWCYRQILWDGEGLEKCMGDHLDGDGFNNDPSNLVPSCNRCNSMRAKAGDRFLTHCGAGHERTPENTYRPPNRANPTCRTCRTEKQRVRLGSRPRDPNRCIRDHDLTPGNYYIYPPSTSRHCRQCKLDYSRDRKRRLREEAHKRRDVADVVPQPAGAPRRLPAHWNERAA